MDRIIRCLQASLDADRAAYRRARSRLILAEASMVRSLNEWQEESDPTDRRYYRGVAWSKLRLTRRRRKAFAGVERCLRASYEAYQSEIASRRHGIRWAA